jgi:GT2 family glycosyltransferase
MYGEDADLCARARLLGARPRMTPEATIVHFGGASTAMFANRIVYVLGSRIGLINRYVPRLWRPYCRAMMIFWAGWRSLVYRGLARFSPRYAKLANEWTGAWRRRDEWRNGPLRMAVKAGA